MKKTMKVILGVLAVVFIAGFLAVHFGYADLRTKPADISGGSPTGGASSAGASAVLGQNPAYTYSAVDSFSATTFTLTSNIKIGTDAPVSSLAAPTAGLPLQYWASNSTPNMFCPVVNVPSVELGPHTVQARCFVNGSVTTKVYDNDNALFLTDGGGANNLTMGANGVYNLEARYQGTAKKASMPFGGCMIVEVPSTVTNIAVSGAGIGGTCPYPVTYTVSSTSNTYRSFAVPTGFDASGAGDLKKITMQLTSGASNPSGTAYVKFLAANYYVGNDGNFHLGVEKDANADTTATIAGPAGQFSFVIA